MFPHGQRDSDEFESTPRRDSEEFESTPVEEEHLTDYPFDDDFQHPSVSQRSDTEELSSTSDSHGKRSPIELFVDPGEKVEVILGKIGVDINRALTAKRQRMETAARQSLDGVEQKIKDVWNAHEDAMAQLNEESAQAFANLFEQWNEDFKKFREQHEKLVNDFQQQEKVFQQSRLVQNQRLRTIKQVHEQFLKNLEDLEKRNDALLTGTQSELKEEINKLQRKIMRESQQQEMANVRESLQSVLFRWEEYVKKELKLKGYSSNGSSEPCFKTTISRNDKIFSHWFAPSFFI